MRFSFILLAGGSSNRFKSNLPKPYHKIGGKTLLEISLGKIRQFKEFKRIIIVCNKKHKKFLKKIKLENVKIINGGKNRQESTYNALSYLKKNKNIDRVLIHDAARPNFSLNLIKRILISSKNNEVIIPALNPQDALKEKKNKNVFLSLKRNKFFLTQTPQCFNFKKIFDLHKRNKDTYKDDDLSLIINTRKFPFIPFRCAM